MAAAAPFEQFFVDKDIVDQDRLRARLRRVLTRRQISLTELLDAEPLEQGLAELVAWLSLPLPPSACGTLVFTVQTTRVGKDVGADCLRETEFLANGCDPRIATKRGQFRFD